MHQLSTALTVLNPDLNTSLFTSLLNILRITPCNKAGLNSRENILNEASALKPNYLFISSALPFVTNVDQVILKVKQISPKTKIVLLINETENLKVSDYLLLNLDAILFQESISDSFEFAIKQISKGEIFICSRSTFELKVDLMQKNLETRINTELLDHLTDRELEVLYSLTQGMNYKQIAQLLVISESTVKTHINNIFTKLNVNDRTQAVLYALKHGIENLVKKSDVLSDLFSEMAGK